MRVWVRIGIVLATSVLLVGHSCSISNSEGRQWSGWIEHEGQDNLDAAQQFYVNASVCADGAQDARNEAARILNHRAKNSQDLSKRDEQVVARASHRYAANVHCLLRMVSALVPGSPPEQIHNATDEEHPFHDEQHLTDPLVCPREDTQHSNVAARLDTEVRHWELLEQQTVTELADPAPEEPAGERYLWLTSPERFPSDMSRLAPFFSPSGGAAWVSYHPNNGKFQVSEPTLWELLVFCDRTDSGFERFNLSFRIRHR